MTDPLSYLGGFVVVLLEYFSPLSLLQSIVHEGTRLGWFVPGNPRRNDDTDGGR